MNLYLLIGIMLSILIYLQCHQNFIEVKKLKYMLEIDIYRKFLKIFWYVLRVGGISKVWVAN